MYWTFFRDESKTPQTPFIGRNTLFYFKEKSGGSSYPVLLS